jgi:hypothetical protein
MIYEIGCLVYVIYISQQLKKQSKKQENKNMNETYYLLVFILVSFCQLLSCSWCFYLGVEYHKFVRYFIEVLKFLNDQLNFFDVMVTPVVIFWKYTKKLVGKINHNVFIKNFKLHFHLMMMY